MGTNMDVIEVTLTSDEVFALALSIAATSDIALAPVSVAVTELVKSAISLKNMELHMALTHPAPAAAVFGGGFGESH
jgi:hypothetical protein